MGLKRRDFMKLVAAASAGLAGCASPPARKLIPYVVPPEEIVPGVSTWYKSTCRECPAGCGTLVRTREGRVLKVEGNPDHPVNRGALCIRGQAAVQGLYNPDRIRQPLRKNARGQFEPISWEEGERILADLLRYLREEGQAERVALISHRVTGSLDKFFREWLAAYGSRRYLQYEPFAYEALREANRRSFGTTEIPHYDIARARFLLNFGADFLETWVSNVDSTRQFAEFRRDFSRRYLHVEPRQSLTAANADEWLAIGPETEFFLALGILRELIDAGFARGLAATEAVTLRRLLEGYTPEAVASATGVAAERVRSLARELGQASPSLVLYGGETRNGARATETQVVVNLLNVACGNLGRTVHFGQGTDYDSVARYRQVRDLIASMQSEDVLAAFFYHANPLFTLPAAAGMAEALSRVPFKVSFSTALDETTAACDLILPDHSPLERWEDYQPRPGVYGLSQPCMQPVFDTKATPDILLTVSEQVAPALGRRFAYEGFRDYLREQWRPLQRRLAPRQGFDEFWQQAVESGGVFTQAAARRVTLRRTALNLSLPQPPSAREEELSLVVFPSLPLYDGRGANRPWLQETPDAVTKIVWSNWVEIHPQKAAQLGILESDLLRVTSEHGSFELPAHITEGIHPEAVAVPLGQGHTAYGRYAEGRGANPLAVLSPEVEPESGGRLWAGTRVRIEKLAINRPLVRTQQHDSQEGRGFAQVIPLADLTKGRQPEPPRLPKLYPEHEHKEHRWAMVVDHNACVGCNACIAACYAENNVPVVGPAQVERGRHMAWIRVERYYEPAAAGNGQKDARFTLMFCQQCDQAPCESVCPVYATYHNPEGLNVQVYNRCVGTRYCSNNCPYKVRRFNWFDPEFPPPLDLQLNPDVSVRSKGVMEKCTFCIQRIREGKDRAKDEGRKPRDGEITPACAQTCPAQAIVFGDLKDPESRVAQLSREGRRYRILEDVNTEPAVTYLKKVTRESEEV